METKTQQAQLRRALLTGEIGEALTHADTLPALLQRCCESVVRHLDAASARIWTMEPGDRALRLVASAGLAALDAPALDGALDGPPRIVAVGQHMIGRIAQDAKEHFSNDVLNDPAVTDRAWAEREGMVSFAGHPMVIDGRVVGVVATFFRAAIDEHDFLALGTVADMMALGIERKRGETHLRVLVRELESNVQTLRRANEDLENFAYITSHDLKAPLHAIANLASWIEEDSDSALSDESREHLRLLRGRANRLDSLIDGILRYSRVGRRAEKLQEVDTAVLVREVCELLATPDSVALTMSDEMPTLVTERAPLEQVLMNLIGNALKHCGKSRPNIEVTVKELPDVWLFSVADDGRGIAARHHRQLWSLFQALEKRESGGIGLAVVRKLVEQRGGRAWVESELGCGARFHFTWPKRVRA